MKNRIYLMTVLGLFIAILLSNTVNAQKMKNGKVGKYTYSYMKKSGMVGVTFDRKGINVGDTNASIEYQDIMIVTALMQTINSISGYKDVSMSALKTYRVENGKILLKGKNCTYRITFVIDGNYITDMAYNDCN